ncbi:NAD-dependent dehydratase, putative [Babesia ovis]|uniref:NAD-dependent dehydratase, putative n=1 Tax=Babesia ovis TaxID=5869 RepID=A0A9W5T8U3_BABOV|nr:NAD-dependent dehydratase, putative [Babesia ovis]
MDKSPTFVQYFSAEGWDDSVTDTVEGSDRTDGYYYTPKINRAQFTENYASIPAEETGKTGGFFSFLRKDYAMSDTSDISDASVVDHGIALPSDATFAGGDASSRRLPRKIIITLRMSDLLRYPLLRLSNCISVIRFQRSILDARAASDNVYRSLPMLPNLFALTSPSGLIFARDLVKSVWHRYGWMGFYRGFGEYVAHRLLTDIMRFIVPRYIAPPASAMCKSIYQSVLSFEPESVRHLRKHYIDEGLLTSEKLSELQTSSFYDFVKRNFEVDWYRFFEESLVELFTYPMLTVSSRMMIYDGPYSLDTATLFKGMLAWDGISTLYRGFAWRLVSLFFDHLLHRHERRSRRFGFAMGSHFTALDQSVPFFLTVGSTISQQLSLIRRCMSSMDGFCAPASSRSILSEFPWLTIAAQMTLAVCVMHLKDRMMD